MLGGFLVDLCRPLHAGLVLLLSIWPQHVTAVLEATHLVVPPSSCWVPPSLHVVRTGMHACNAVPAGFYHTQRMELALRSSIALVAAFATDDVYGDDPMHRPAGSGHKTRGASESQRRLARPIQLPHRAYQRGQGQGGEGPPAWPALALVHLPTSPCMAQICRRCCQPGGQAGAPPRRAPSFAPCHSLAPRPAPPSPPPLQHMCCVSGATACAFPSHLHAQASRTCTGTGS